MNYNDFLNLPEIKKRNAEPGDAGILIHEGDKISENINLGKTRNEIKEYLKNLFPGLDEETINEFLNEAINQNLNKEQLKDFANKKLPNGLKLESINTSAINSEKTTNTKNTSFIPKTPTPTLDKTNFTKTNIERSTDDEKDGPEIE